MPGIKRLPNETDNDYWERVEGIIDGMDCLDTRNGQVIARYPSKYRVAPYAVDELTGFLSVDFFSVDDNFDADDEREKALREKYALAN